MNILIKRVLTVAALVAVSALILLATKTYGVWVISGIAVLLAGIGLLRNEPAPGAPRPQGRPPEGLAPAVPPLGKEKAGAAPGGPGTDPGADPGADPPPQG
jgi:hypothetical protein